jgi:chromosome segregation ATPase
MPRLTPADLARYRADYHECRVTVVPLLDEVDALLAERDAARGEWDDLHRETEKLRTTLDERDSDLARAWAVLRECGADDVALHDRDLADAVRRLAGHFARLCREEVGRLTAERDRLAVACREAVERLGQWQQTAQECRSQADDLARRCGVACTREWADLAERWRWLAEAWERLAALLPPDLLRDALAPDAG